MAILKSEDEDYGSFLSLTRTRKSREHVSSNVDQIWEGYSLVLGNGPLKMNFGDGDEDGYLFCRRPQEMDEIKMLCLSIGNFLDEKHQTFEFEPAEPCFELKLERVENFGVKVHIFVDHGNAKTEISRWDAFGLRFFTTDAHLSDFINELKTEFAW